MPPLSDAHPRAAEGPRDRLPANLVRRRHSCRPRVLGGPMPRSPLSVPTLLAIVMIIIALAASFGVAS